MLDTKVKASLDFPSAAAIGEEVGKAQKSKTVYDLIASLYEEVILAGP